MQQHFIKIIQIEQHLPLRTRFCGEYEQFLGLCVFYDDFGQGSILEYALFRTETPQISTAPKDGQLYHPGGDRRNA